MGIQSYLKRVSKATSDIKDAINTKGGSCSECDSIEVLANAVLAIPTGTSDSGDALFTVLAFKSTTSQPSTPSGGSWSSSATSISYPSGWSDGSGMASDIWMSYKVYKADGSVYKDWVSPIKVSGTSSSSSIDLSDYATQEWVLEKIADISVEGGDTSINGLTGSVKLIAGENIGITKNTADNSLTFTASGVNGSKGDQGDPGKDGDDGDTFVSVAIYILTDSADNKPATPSGGTYNFTTNTLENVPSGWSTESSSEVGKYTWRSAGIFSKKNNGAQVGSWGNPICMTGAPGPKGEDGDTWEEVFATTSTSYTPIIVDTAADSNSKTKTDDGYLPQFNFNGTLTEAVSAQPSPSSSAPYVWGTKRRGNTGSWSDFFSPYLVSMWVDAGLTDEEKEAIVSRVTESITTELDDANKRVTAIEARVDKIDGTDATFFTDKQEALISAITSYKDSDQKSFADLIVDGKEADIKAWAGGEFTENGRTLLKDAGIDIDGMESTVTQWATFYDADTMKTGSVREILDAESAKITNAAATQADEKVALAKTELNGELATITNDVAKGYYFWAKYEAADNGVNKISEKADYDLSDVGEGKTYTDVSAYEKAMTDAGWEKETVINALSTITQEAGKITIAASEGESWASIVAKANAATGSDITLNADRINLSGTTSATTANIANANIVDATITNATISKGTITSATIESELKSKNYSNGESSDKNGFLFDPTSDKGKFAIYGKTSDGEAFEITNDSFVIPKAVIGTLTLSELSDDIDVVTTSSIIDLVKRDLEGKLWPDIKNLINSSTDITVKTLTATGEDSTDEKEVYVGTDTDLNIIRTQVILNSSDNDIASVTPGEIKYYTYYTNNIEYPDTAATLWFASSAVGTKLTSVSATSGISTSVKVSAYLYKSSGSETLNTWTESDSEPTITSVKELASDLAISNYSQSSTEDGTKTISWFAPNTTICSSYNSSGVAQPFEFTGLEVGSYGIVYVFKVMGGNNTKELQLSVIPPYLNVNKDSSEKRKGVFVTQKGILVNAAVQTASIRIKDDNTIVSEGFVTSIGSNSVDSIKIVGTLSECTSANTLYIILSS